MKRLNLDNFTEEVLESEKPYFVLFKNSSCHLCRGFTNGVLPKLYRKYNKVFKFGIVDTNIEEDLMDIFNIEGVPTIILFKDGEDRELDFPENASPYSGYPLEYVESFMRDFI